MRKHTETKKMETKNVERITSDELENAVRTFVRDESAWSAFDKIADRADVTAFRCALIKMAVEMELLERAAKR